MKTVWFNCGAGVAGDMLLAALIDAGASKTAVMDAWAATGITGFAATWERVERCGVGALWTNLVVDDRHEHGQHEHTHHAGQQTDGGLVHRPAGDVIDLIERADLPPPVIAMAGAVYRRLAEVEGHIHGVAPEAVELHEVGALDSILDVIGVAAALHDLGIERITASPVAVGHGTVDIAHGVVPNPVPAVVELMVGAAIPTAAVDTTMELATPTGVAILAVGAESFGPMPPMTLTANGFGAGTADPAGRANIVHAVIGNATPETAAATESNRDVAVAAAVVTETNVDDATGEILADTISQLLAAGASDAWVTPIVMKKGRPAYTVSVLSTTALADECRTVLLRATGSIGARSYGVQKWPSQRQVESVSVDGYQIGIKRSPHRIKVEHDDAAAAAVALGRPLREILIDAEYQARKRT